MEMAVFAVFGLLALASSLAVVAHKSPIYSTLNLVLTLFSVAVLFVLLGAPFIATLQLLIYAGAILVLFLFVIMLLNVGRDEGVPAGHRAQLAAALVGALVFAGMLWLLLRPALGTGPPPPPLGERLVSLSGLAQELFDEYLLPFEIVGLLLLVAVIGATVIARRPTPEELAAAAGAVPAAPAAPATAATPATPEMAAAAAAAGAATWPGEAAPSWAAWAPEAAGAAGGARPAAFRGGSAAKRGDGGGGGEAGATGAAGTGAPPPGATEPEERR
jgi:NADH-quinone oxidoreductase subunit J